MSLFRQPSVLEKIEDDILTDKPLATILRKVVLMGGQIGSAELRAWASSELRGYRDGEELPRYRTVRAPLHIDGTVPGGIVHHQPISATDLPDFARPDVDEAVPLRLGVAELARAVDDYRDERVVKMQMPGAAILVKVMNSQMSTGRVVDLYWAVSTVALAGVLDQIRSRLAELVAELRSVTPAARDLPTAQQATHALSVVVRGRGSRVTVAQATTGGTVTVQPTDEGAEAAAGFWTTARSVGAGVVGIFTIAGVLIAWWQLQAVV